MREEDESSTPNPAVKAEPGLPTEVVHEGPIDLSTALDVAQVGLELMALVLAVPKGRAAAEAMARKMGAVIAALRPPFSAPGDPEAFLVRDAVHEWLDARYGPGLWIVGPVAFRREVGKVIVALEESRSGEAYILVVVLHDYSVVELDR